MAKTIRSTQQIQPVNEAGVVVVPLVETSKDSGGYSQTSWLSIRRVGPMDLQPGEEVLLLAYEQIDNEASARAGDPWREYVVRNVGPLVKEGSIQQQKKAPWRVSKVPTYKQGAVVREAVDVDPRRTLDVMVELGVWRGASPSSIIGATNVVRNRGTNLDNMTHHGPWESHDTDIIQNAYEGIYFVTAVRFAWTPLYMPQTGAKMEVLDRGMLSAKVEP